MTASKLNGTYNEMFGDNEKVFTRVMTANRLLWRWVAIAKKTYALRERGDYSNERQDTDE